MIKERLNQSAQKRIDAGERCFELKNYAYECMGTYGMPDFIVIRHHLETGETDYPRVPSRMVGNVRKRCEDTYQEGSITQEQLAAFYIATYRLKHSHNIKEYIALCAMYKEVFGHDYQTSEV